MAGKLSTSFGLVKASAGVLKQDKEILLFPAISGVSVVLVAATFFVPAWMLGFGEALENPGILGYTYLFLFYLVQYTVMFFFHFCIIWHPKQNDSGGLTQLNKLSLPTYTVPLILTLFKEVYLPPFD